MTRWQKCVWLWLALALAGCERKYLPGSIEVYFSPKGGCTEAVVREIDAARSTILVQAYSFTSKPIAEALRNAHQRGVQVQVLLDRSNESDRYSGADFIRDAGIPLGIDAEHAIAHNKIMILDDKTVVTGSFNFTKQAEASNAENLLILQDPALAARYAENWRAHASHCKEYVSKLEAGDAERDKELSHGRRERKR
jgi:phosphatidylserine/phosphatidylglycerophosphate/cardiolipin synthase-like enzyme